MPRRARGDIEGAVHHVMNRGVDRQTTFFSDRDRVEFGQRLSDIHDRFAVETIAYCLMDNHYHLVVRAPRGNLGSAMHHLGLVYTQRTNERVGRDGPLFRGRYHSIPIMSDAYLAQAVRYVHRNPLARADVCRADQWRWSSYRAYLGRRRAPSFLYTQLVLGLFGDDVGRLERFTDGDAPWSVSAPVSDVTQMVRLSIALDDLEVGTGEDVARWQERTVLLLLADRWSGSPVGERLLSSFAFPSAAARRMAMRRARLRAADPAIARIVRRVEQQVDHDLAA